MRPIWIVILCLVVVGLVIFLGQQFYKYKNLAHKYYEKEIKPGETYKVGNRTYTLPNLPLKGKAMKLNEQYLLDMRQLFIDVNMLFKDVNIETWVSGGTLLGFMRHKTFIVWDDDIDQHVDWKHRDYLFSKAFAETARKKHLEVLFLKGTSLDYARKEGGGVRLRHMGKINPVCDIFFVKEKQPGLWGKVDSWNKNKIHFNKKEQWITSQLFPVQPEVIDDLQMNVPKEPINVLKQQYGKNVMDSMYARSTWFSHTYPFEAFPWVWKNSI